jgi:hypothetical protein
MVSHMKTTLVIPDPGFRDLKKPAVDRNTTISELSPLNSCVRAWKAAEAQTTTSPAQLQRRPSLD